MIQGGKNRSYYGSVEWPFYEDGLWRRHFAHGYVVVNPADGGSAFYTYKSPTCRPYTGLTVEKLNRLKKAIDIVNLSPVPDAWARAGFTFEKFPEVDRATQSHATYWDHGYIWDSKGNLTCVDMTQGGAVTMPPKSSGLFIRGDHGMTDNAQKNTATPTYTMSDCNRRRLALIRELDGDAHLVSAPAVAAWRVGGSFSISDVTRYSLRGNTVCALKEDGTRFNLGCPEGASADEAVLARWRSLRAYDILAVESKFQSSGEPVFQIFRRLPGVETGWSRWTNCLKSELPVVAKRLYTAFDKFLGDCNLTKWEGVVHPDSPKDRWMGAPVGMTPASALDPQLRYFKAMVRSNSAIHQFRKHNIGAPYTADLVTLIDARIELAAAVTSK